MLTKPQFSELPPQSRDTSYRKSDPFRGDGDINYKQPNQPISQKNQSDLFGGNNFYQGRRALVPGYQEYADGCKADDMRIHIHTKQVPHDTYEERRTGRRYIPEPNYSDAVRPTGRKHVQPIEHIEPDQYNHPHPHYVPSDIFRSTEGIPQVTEAMKNYKPPANYTQIGENEKIWQPRAQHKLWESHKDTIVGVQYPMDLTKQPVSIDNRKCQIDQQAAMQQLKENAQLANKYKQRIFE